MIRSNRPTHILLVLLAACLLTTAATGQDNRKPIHIFLDLRETNLDNPSTVAKNTLNDRLAAAGFKVTTKRREADLVLEGALSSRLTAVTDDVKREGGVNAEATASVRLLSGAEVVDASVQRSAPGDWGVQAERVGEDRLIEVAGLVADDMFSGDVVNEVSAFPESRRVKEGITVIEVGAISKPTSRDIKPARKSPKSKRGPNRGMTFMEVAWLVQNYAPEERVVEALHKYGIKFKPRDAAIAQLRSFGASEIVVNAVKTSNVV
jgi:hypothetical protein